MNNQAPSTNNQIMTKIPMTEIFPSSDPSPLGREGEGEGRLGHWKLEIEICLEFGIWLLEFHPRVAYA
jgi:hypothetical protein